MAIDQSNVALDLASKAAQAAGELLDAADTLNDILAHATAAGINMVNHNDVLEASPELQHVDGATINKLATVVPGLIGYIQGTSVSGDTYEQVLYKIRR